MTSNIYNYIKIKDYIQHMERSVLLTYKNIKREFVISTKTKPPAFKNLVRKAFHLQSEIKYLKNFEAQRIGVEDLILQSRGGQYEIVLDDDSSEDKSKSEVCSQKNMSKVSGRKNPPSEKELLDSKFYIDDFQLFMSEVTTKKTNKLFGIVFFNSRKKASFLGKKILRELIFQFDKIQFFYALHPIKMHTSSALLGQILVFSIFRGKKMIHEREFAEQITAADQIPNYIKNLIKTGQISFDQPINQQKKTKNLIHVHEQRSFDHQIQNSPQKLSDFGGKPNRTAQLIKIKAVTPDKDIKNRKIFANPKQDSPIKSHITNQISFQSQFYQPQWFFQGEYLSRLQKGILSALIKGNDQNLITFLNGLSLKDKSKEKLHIKLVKVFLKEFIDEKFINFTESQRKFIEENQQNRKNFVFTSLLKLYKFGDINDFIQGLAKGLLSIKDTIPLRKIENNIIHYSNIAKHNDKIKPSFTIKLLDCQNQGQSVSPREHPSPFRQNSKLHFEHTQLARLFHAKPLDELNKSILKNIDFGREYDEAQRAGICDLILKNDAFMTESFVKNLEKAKKSQRMQSKTVKKYLRQIESRYDSIRQRTVADRQLNLKMQKLQIFNGLLYYLYKQRIINKKQLKISFYLYTWSDLNVLSAFEVYLEDRSIEQFVDTVYSIDYNYYLLGLYEIDHSQVEHFTLQTESQLIILFLYENYIDSGDERISLQKFIRAGDKSLLKLYTDLRIEQQDLIRKMIELSKEKKEELDNINKNQKIAECETKEKKKDRCNFIDQIVQTRLKTIKKKDLIKYCINNDESQITGLFDKLDQMNEQHQFIESLKKYSERIDEVHMKSVIDQLAKEAGIDNNRISQCREDIIKGIYETYMVTNDKSDTIDTLQRAIRKAGKINSPNSPK